jgi:hypothetical protein
MGVIPLVPGRFDGKMGRPDLVLACRPSSAGLTHPAARGGLRRAVAAVAGRLVERRCWERLGFARLRDYSVERLGLSAREVQDLARVDGALQSLPLLESALRAGALGWTKVRLVARVATPGDEARWIALAQVRSARALAREVRAVGGAEEAAGGEAPEDEEEPRITLRLPCTPRVRAKWAYARQLARRVAGEALPSWECMERVAAEVLSAFPLDEAGEDALAPGNAPGFLVACTGTGWVSGAAPSPAMCSAEHVAEQIAERVDDLMGALEGADAFELDARLRRAIALEQQLDGELAAALLHAARGRLHLRGGFLRFEDYACERYGISPRKARGLLRVARAGERNPCLSAAFRDGRVSWVQAHALVAVVEAAPEHAQAWLAHAERVSFRRLEDDVDRALLRVGAVEGNAALAPPEAECLEERPAERQTGAHATEPAPELPSAEICEVAWSAPRAAAWLFLATLGMVRRRLERAAGRPVTEGEALEAMLEHAFVAWGACERVRREHRVFTRDGWRCTVPGCSSYRNLHDHHIVYRSAGGSDDESNRTTLCVWHHLRGVHAGTVRCAGRAPEGLRFALGVRPGAAPLISFGPGEVLIPATA